MSVTTALVRKNLLIARNALLGLRWESRFKVAFIACFALAFEVFLGLLFLNGLRFLDKMGGAGTVMLGRLFSLFFLGMGLMLVVSGIVTSYATLFRSDEIPFLLLQPVHIEKIVLHKFYEATMLSSWAFFFVVLPFMTTYALHQRLAISCALWTFLLALPFLIITAGIGALLVLVFQRWLATLRLLRLAVWAGLAWFGVRLARLVAAGSADPDSFGFNLAKLIPGLRLATNPLLPSFWLSEGISCLSRGAWVRGLMFFGLLVSTALMMLIAVEWLGGAVFHEAWQRATCGFVRQRRARISLGSLQRPLSFLPNDVRAILLKDLRTFMRDPLQWSQVLIFFGLLALYFANLRTLRYHELPEGWRNAIALLNVFSVSAVVCSLASRFLYPQLSLEGHGFWILGLSPLRLRRVLMIKFYAAASALVLVSAALMALCGHMLQTAIPVRVIGLATVCGISLAVCGLSLGLGAIFLDLEQRNPAAIVSGFGGTLNLVLNLVVMLAALMPFPLLFHLQRPTGVMPPWTTARLTASVIWLVTVCGTATVVPLYLGGRSLEEREL